MKKPLEGMRICIVTSFLGDKQYVVDSLINVLGAKRVDFTSQTDMLISEFFDISRTKIKAAVEAQCNIVTKKWLEMCYLNQNKVDCLIFKPPIVDPKITESIARTASSISDGSMSSNEQKKQAHPNRFRNKAAPVNLLKNKDNKKRQIGNPFSSLHDKKRSKYDYNSDFNNNNVNNITNSISMVENEMKILNSDELTEEDEEEAEIEEEYNDDDDDDDDNDKYNHDEISTDESEDETVIEDDNSTSEDDNDHNDDDDAHETSHHQTHTTSSNNNRNNFNSIKVKGQHGNSITPFDTFAIMNSSTNKDERRNPDRDDEDTATTVHSITSWGASMDSSTQQTHMDDYESEQEDIPSADKENGHFLRVPSQSESNEKEVDERLINVLMTPSHDRNKIVIPFQTTTNQDQPKEPLFSDGITGFVSSFGDNNKNKKHNSGKKKKQKQSKSRKSDAPVLLSKINKDLELPSSSSSSNKNSASEGCIVVVEENSNTRMSAENSIWSVNSSDDFLHDQDYC
eukprot:TRINITY_DN822_c0_g1_i10.p1 TRINITY_DN822_c0_g1~~TRINITY_DN822_c0_g1_i10.p1  ORF type:complete len:513 (+),score=155.26 TRINITY_DN822_c0_g1_i10:1456-2994(+)